MTDRVLGDERVGVYHRSSSESVSFAGYRFPPDVILLAVRWYLRYALSYRYDQELLTERRIDVDHVTIYRWGTVALGHRARLPAANSGAGKSALAAEAIGLSPPTDVALVDRPTQKPQPGE